MDATALDWPDLLQPVYLASAIDCTFSDADTATVFPHLNHYIAYLLYWVWVFIVIVPFCVLYYAFIERPGIRLGDRWRKTIEVRRNARMSEIEGTGNLGKS